MDQQTQKEVIKKSAAAGFANYAARKPLETTLIRLIQNIPNMDAASMDSLVQAIEPFLNTDNLGAASLHSPIKARVPQADLYKSLKKKVKHTLVDIIASVDQETVDKALSIYQKAKEIKKSN